MAEIDQSMIDQLVATAEEDTPESKIAKLEKEVETLKGSIKKLLLDIRETMNNLENPFQSLQNLAEVINRPIQPQPQQVQVIPAPPPEEKREEKKEEEKEEEKVEEEIVKEDFEKAEDEKFEDYSEVDNLIQVPVSKPKPEKKVKEVMPKGGGKLGIVALYNMMEWARTMLEKYDVNTVKEILELFESAGYISSELKDFTLKMVDIVSVVGNGLEELLIDIYRLHKAVNPNDRSMDSELLKILLEKRGDGV